MTSRSLDTRSYLYTSPFARYKPETQIALSHGLAAMGALASHAIFPPSVAQSRNNYRPSTSPK